MKKTIFTLLAIAITGIAGVNAQVYVRHDAAAGGDGSSWETAYKTISEALGSGEEIRVAAGVYKEAELIIEQGDKVIGGWIDASTRKYPGEATPGELTILDGNSLINTDPVTKHRVATVYGTLEGCVIRNGHAHEMNGGGALVDGGMVLNCIIKGNVAMSTTGNDAKGGGAYLQNSGKLVNCVVAYNMANNGYGVAGTGEVINNTITANTYAPTAIAIDGGTYKRFKHWRDATSFPWPSGNAFNPATDEDPTPAITINDFSIAETQTTTSQYAVFAAAMDLVITTTNNNQLASFADAIILSNLTDPTRNDAVGTYMKFTFVGNEALFQAGAEELGFGLQQVGNDFIYYPTRANEAMTYVSWYGALAYSLWLGGTLPTEGQWEYAARYNKSLSALDNTLYSGANSITDLNNIATYSANSNNRVNEVAIHAANNAGLYDMTGNVWEFCADIINAAGNNGTYPDYTSQTAPYNTLTDPIWTSGNNGRVRRGGSFFHGNTTSDLTIPYRALLQTTDVGRTSGFRPAFK